MKTAEKANPALVSAYSYMRFSSVPQGAGDSIRRQTTAALDWCSRKGARLDESLTFKDLGKSAYLGEHRKNPDRHALAAFLQMVQDGRIPRGSFLVIESLDRLTREHVRAGLMLLLGLIEAGVRIVQLSPSELIYDQTSDEMALMLAIVELSRGHRESKRKSDLIKSVWNSRKQRAREGKLSYTGMLPAWIEERDGKLRPIPERAAVVKRVFQMTIDGYGLTSIIRKFAEEDVPAFGEVVVREGRQRSQFSGKWGRAYLSQILRDRRAVGEYQPRRRDPNNRSKKIPDGDPIPGYFPAVVSEAEWAAARAGAAQRRVKPGSIGKHINIFAGLIHHARDGDTYFAMTRVDCHKRPRRSPTRRILINTRATEGDATSYSFPFHVFEPAVLSCLREIDPHDILDGDKSPDESQVLAGELARTKDELAEATAYMDANGFSATIGKRVQALETKERDLTERLAAIQQKAAHPLSQVWDESQSLIAALDTAPDPDDARMRLRSLLRRQIDSIWLLVVPCGKVRLAALQVWFAEGKRCRDYLIYYQAPKANGSAKQPLQWFVRSLADVTTVDSLDLRKRSHVKRLEAALTAVDPATLERGRTDLNGGVADK